LTDSPKKPTHTPYGCQEYRAEMVLLGLQLRLQKENLDDAEKEVIRREIALLEKQMGL